MALWAMRTAIIGNGAMTAITNLHARRRLRPSSRKRAMALQQSSARSLF
jgi:hypothetical protein